MSGIRRPRVLQGRACCRSCRPSSSILLFPSFLGRKGPETAARGASQPDDVAGGRQAIGGLARSFLFLIRPVNVRPHPPARSRWFDPTDFVVETGAKERGMSIEPRIRAFFDERTNTISYLVWEEEEGRGAVIDPVLDFSPASGEAR